MVSTRGRLSAGSVRRDTAPGTVIRRAPEPVPVVRMGRFAIDTDYQGAGWGAELLRDALLSAVNGADLIGARTLLVESPINKLQLFKALADLRASAGLS